MNNETLFRERYEYLSTSIAANKDIETSFVSTLAHNVYDGDTTRLQYTYDAAGNIETVSRDSVLLSKYYYDGLNRLVREDNHTEGKTWVWCYNVGGNITEKRTYNLTTDVNLGSSYTSIPYVYKTSGWKDQLISYNGQQCVYDALGNPTTYRGHALTWSHVRQLDKYDNHTFSYGADGIRYKKNNTTYTLSGSKILKETNGTRTLTYYYGGSGVIGFRYDGTDYYFLKNLQGDVSSIYDGCGNIVAGYHYDAWGKALNVWNFTDANIGDLNPFRYRSYYYDTETGLYYLNSRYYDPETGRFINADTTEVLENAMDDIGGLNLYAYCFNNPVNMCDDTGTWPNWVKKAIAVAAVAVAVVAATVVTCVSLGPGSIAGVAMVTATLTLAARATEVVSLQIKKGEAEGKSGSQITQDSIEALYDNASEIIGVTPFTKLAGTAGQHVLHSTVEKAFGGTQTLRRTLESTGGKVLPYLFVGKALIHTLISIFSDDPLERSKARGYNLK